MNNTTRRHWPWPRQRRSTLSRLLIKQEKEKDRASCFKSGTLSWTGKIICGLPWNLSDTWLKQVQQIQGLTAKPSKCQFAKAQCREGWERFIWLHKYMYMWPLEVNCPLPYFYFGRLQARYPILRIVSSRNDGAQHTNGLVFNQEFGNVRSERFRFTETTVGLVTFLWFSVWQTTYPGRFSGRKHMQAVSEAEISLPT